MKNRETAVLIAVLCKGREKGKASFLFKKKKLIINFKILI